LGSYFEGGRCDLMITLKIASAADTSTKVQTLLDRRGIKYDLLGSHLKITAPVDDAIWEEVPLRSGFTPIVVSVFDEGDYQAAEWLMVTSQSEKGEQILPKHPNTWRDFAPDCHVCASGSKQTIPHRTKGSFKLPKAGLFTIRWVFDDLFVGADTFDAVFRDAPGMSSFPLIGAGGVEIESAVQIQPTVLVPVAEREWNVPCTVCGARTLTIPQVGLFPGPMTKPSADVWRVAQPMAPKDSGGQRHPVIVHKRIADQLRARGIQFGFHPVGD
jgi:hypothetical protein